MKILSLLILLFFSGLVQAQLKMKFKQYMLHQMVFNPGFVDVETKFSVNSLYRRQWLRQENYPESFIAYGHYNINRTHGVGLLLSNDLVNKFNQFEIGANYVYNIPIGYDYNLGVGVKVGMIEQNLLNTNLTYFDPVEPTLSEGSFTQKFLNVGTGVSLTSRNLNVHIGLPQLWGNSFINPTRLYDFKYNHLYTSVGYKFRQSDWFIVYPNLMMYAVRGSKPHGSLHVNFLASQLVWAGVGVDTDLTLNASFGLFTQSGWRFVYAIDNRFFPKNQTTGVSHELSLSYAKTIKDNPFSKRKSRGFSGGRRRMKIKRWR